MQFAQRNAQHVALLADGMERGRMRRAGGGRDRAQHLAERERIVGLDRRDAARSEAEAVEDRLSERNRLVKSRDVVARLGAGEKANARGAISEGAGHRFEPDLRHLVDGERQHVRRQPVAVARERVDQRGAMRLVVQQHDRVGAAARLRVGGEHRAQLAQQRVGRRQRVGGGAGRAHRGALSAAGAHVRIDRDVITGGRRSRRWDTGRDSDGSRRSSSANARRSPA